MSSMLYSRQNVLSITSSYTSRCTIPGQLHACNNVQAHGRLLANLLDCILKMVILRFAGSMSQDEIIHRILEASPRSGLSLHSQCSCFGFHTMLTLLSQARCWPYGGFKKSAKCWHGGHKVMSMSAKDANFGVLDLQGHPCRLPQVFCSCEERLCPAAGSGAKAFLIRILHQVQLVWGHCAAL